jgi:hypothetical protein
VYKPAHAKMTIRRTQRVFRPYQERLDYFAARFCSQRARLRLRAILDFPRRRIHGLSGNLVSFERNFFPRAQRWAQGKGPYELNGGAWGLGEEDLELRPVTRAGWETGAAGIARP